MYKQELPSLPPSLGYTLSATKNSSNHTILLVLCSLPNLIFLIIPKPIFWCIVWLLFQIQDEQSDLASYILPLTLHQVWEKIRFERKSVWQIIFSFFALVVELKTSEASLLQIITGRTFPAAHASSHPTDDNDLLPFPPRLDDLVPMWSIVICSAQLTINLDHPCHLHQPEKRGARSHLTVYSTLFSPTWWWSQNIQYLNSLSL